MKIKNILFFILILSTSVSAYANYDLSVYEAQTALIAKGYSPGAADGYTGAKTKKAIKKYQHEKELDVTGSLDLATRTLLGVIKTVAVDDETLVIELTNVIRTYVGTQTSFVFGGGGLTPQKPTKIRAKKGTMFLDLVLDLQPANNNKFEIYDIGIGTADKFIESVRSHTTIMHMDKENPNTTLEFSATLPDKPLEDYYLYYKKMRVLHLTVNTK